MSEAPRVCLQVHADARALFAIRISLLRVHIFPSSGWTCCQSRVKTLLLSQILYNKQRKNTPTVKCRQQSRRCRGRRVAAAG